MRRITPLAKAIFQNEKEAPHPVTVPHTWNAFDGQDGGNDYYRGEGVYTFDLPDPGPGTCRFVEFRAANHSADVYVNGVFAGRHEGGFSTFRFEITGLMKPRDNVMTVKTDNSRSHIYPQRADFTFFGGLYRPVYYLEVSKSHFDLLYSGSDGVFVTPKADGSVSARVLAKNGENCRVVAEIFDGEDVVAAETLPAEEEVDFALNVQDPKLWDGRETPHLYRFTVSLMDRETELDRVSVRFGFRAFSVDPDRGFFLNGRSYPLHGVSRHQDRQDLGWAITEKEHREDLALIEELGANSIRLAHYQHDQFFYDLCDEEGFVVWAEIPFISQFLFGEKSRENTLSQMRELILQNYNHPSICFWGIANETTIGKNSPELEENLRALNELTKALDPTRPTTMAHLASVTPTHPHTDITDLQGVNIYYGWYSGTIEDNGPKLDAMHEGRPKKPLSLSEYGVDNLITWHSARPINHDYTEEYAVDYHQKMLCIFASRPYLFATYEWNMFDFAADARDEGGVKGRNCKGLVSYDRKTKKDAFFVYQAFWTKTPMVRIIGRRFVNRAPGERTISVFTNEKTVALSLNGSFFAVKEAVDHRADFPDLPFKEGENTVSVTAVSVSDSCVFRAVSEHDTSYDFPGLSESAQAGNWFAETEEGTELPAGEGYDADDSIGALLSNEEADRIVRGWIMAKTDAPLDRRLLCVCRLATWKNECPDSRLREKKSSICAIMTEEDFAVLNRRLHTVRKTNP